MAESKKGLGKGLSAILGGSSDQVSTENISKINPEKLVSSAYQPRISFKEQELHELGESLKQNGMLQPIIIRKLNNEKYEIIAGERRWRAALAIQMRQVPVIIKDVTDEQAQTIALIENIQRSDLNIIEEAEAYQRLVTELGYTQEKVAEMVSKSRSHIANILRLNTLPGTIKKLVQTNQLSFGHAKILVGYENADGIANIIITKQLNVRQTEKLINKMKRQDKSSEQDIKSLANEILESHLYTINNDMPSESKEYTNECKSIENLIHTYNPHINAEVRIINKNPTIKLDFKDFKTLDNFLEKITS